MFDERSRKRKRKSTLWLHPPKRRRTTIHGHIISETSTRATDPFWTPVMITNEDCQGGVDCRPNTSTRATDQMWTPSQNISNTVCPGSDELTAAPSKTCSREIPPKSKKALFDSNTLKLLLKEIVDILPSILKNLEKAGKHVAFCQFLRLIAFNKFPLNNISFLLLLDVAKWYSLDTTSQMKYAPEAMIFWKAMYRLFHGKVLRFMSGEKSPEQVVREQSKRGSYTPQNTSINFAVPNINAVKNFDNTEDTIPKVITPGIINHGIELRSKEKAYVLSVDGKKLAPGLNRDHGDQDLFGHEQNETLLMTKQRLEKEIKVIEKVNVCWHELNNGQKCENLEEIIKIISARIVDMRKLFLKQTMALQKFQKEAGENWRESKFVYAISSIQSQIYQIRTVVEKLLHINDIILKTGSALNQLQDISRTFCSESTIDICAQGNCLRLKGMNEMPSPEKQNMRFVKQRSDEWFENRKRYKITGSTLYGALGLDTLKKQQSHFDCVIKGVETLETVSEEVQSRLDHGTKSEIHAVATLASKFLPFFFPRLKYIEEGAHVIDVNNEPFMMVSPDGSLCSIAPNSDCVPLPMLGCEFKCPLHADYKTPVHYEIPIRYIPQLLAEMASMRVERLIYLCWTEESSTVFSARFDTYLWDTIMDEVKAIYHGTDLKRPTKLSKTSKTIAEKLKEYRDASTEFQCEIPSVKGQISGMSQTNDTSLYLFPITTLLGEDNNEIEIDMIMNTAASAVREVHEICRKKATEILVWLLSDTDRTWDPEVPHSTPVAYAMAGYSLPVKPMRDMHEHVLQSCFQKGIDVVCSCFDGQWLKLATRDASNRPLTLIQLQRDVYDQSAKVNRKDIIKYFKEKMIVEDTSKDVQIIRVNNSITVSCPKLNKIMIAISRISKEESKKIVNRGEENKLHGDNLSCLPNDALETLLYEGLPVTDAVTQDVVSMDDMRNVSENVCETVPEYSREHSNSSSSSENIVTSKVVLTEKELSTVLCEFQCSKQKSVSKRWKGKTTKDLQNCVSNVQLLKTLTHNELNSLTEVSLQYQKLKGVHIRRSLTSLEKVNALSKVIGSSDQIIKEKTIKQMKSLTEFAANTVERSRKAVTKSALNNVYAVMLYDSAYKKWLDLSPFSEETNIQGVGATTLFSYPERNATRQMLEHRCVDYHHLFVNLRVKVCKDGLQGIRKKAWHSVAEADDSVISKAIVVDLIDKQNNAYAKRTFSANVETVMRSLNFHKEADFCKLVREWYQAEDMPGLSAHERCRRRLTLKNFLLEGVDFGQYPLPGMYVKGFPKVMFEAFLQRIDTAFQLYTSIKWGVL